LDIFFSRLNVALPLVNWTSLYQVYPFSTFYLWKPFACVCLYKEYAREFRANRASYVSLLNYNIYYIGVQIRNASLTKIYCVCSIYIYVYTTNSADRVGDVTSGVRGCDIYIYIYILLHTAVDLCARCYRLEQCAVHIG